MQNFVGYSVNSDIADILCLTEWQNLYKICNIIGLVGSEERILTCFPSMRSKRIGKSRHFSLLKQRAWGLSPDVLMSQSLLDPDVLMPQSLLNPDELMSQSLLSPEVLMSQSWLSPDVLMSMSQSWLRYLSCHCCSSSKMFWKWAIENRWKAAAKFLVNERNRHFLVTYSIPNFHDKANLSVLLRFASFIFSLTEFSFSMLENEEPPCCTEWSIVVSWNCGRWWLSPGLCWSKKVVVAIIAWRVRFSLRIKRRSSN